MKSRPPFSRRRFLKQAGVAATGAFAFPQLVTAATLGLNGRTSANSKINIALIGCGDRGLSGSRAYTRDDRVRFGGLCDPNLDRIERTRAQLLEVDGVHYRIPFFSDFRDVLRHPDIDAVHIATPDHWHVPIALAAARARKDIYCEKPLGLTVEQCLACQEITREHGRVFQYGTQNRSVLQVRRGIEMVLNGFIGPVTKAVVWAPPGISGGFPDPVLPVPPGFDYDLWLGPAPEAPFTYDRCLRSEQNNGIYHIYDYAIGFIAGWGAHPLDQFQWWADHQELGIPERIAGSGEVPRAGLFDTITHWNFTCTYANGFTMNFYDSATYRALKNQGEADDGDLMVAQGSAGSHGSLFIGEEGWINVHRSGWHFSSEALRQRAREVMTVRLPESSNHCHDFVDSIVSRRQPVSNLDSAIRSDIVSHLCNISTRVGRPVHWDAQNRTIRDDPAAQAMMHRDMRDPWSLRIGS